MAWRLAKSLEKLRSQVNTKYPKRSKISDGTIGDAAHAASASDHNPNAAGVVCALDLTHDPRNGFDAHKLADHLRVNRHPALKYIISNRRICGAWTGWRWQAYGGINPHSSHVHISVGVGPDGRSTGAYDNMTAWSLVGSERKEMVTRTGLSVIYRFLLGREPSEAGLKNYVGKVTFDEAYKKIRSSAQYKSRVKAVRSSLAHLPSDIRKGIK